MLLILVTRPDPRAVTDLNLDDKMDGLVATFIKYNRTEAARQLQSKPIANHVLSVIAQRARFQEDAMSGLQAGQCYMGDFATIGLTRQQYRSAIKLLQSRQIITIKTTNRGTIVTLIDNGVYDINSAAVTTQTTTEQPSSNHQANHQTTTQQPPEQPLNKNLRKKEGKNDKKERISKFALFYDAYPRKVSKQAAQTAWLKIDDGLYDSIITHVQHRDFGEVRYAPYPASFLNQRRWEDVETNPRPQNLTDRNIQVAMNTELP